ncbi:MAG: four helix bundle protein [bacterium]
MISGYEQLRVWEQAHALALAIYTVTKQFPASELYGLTSQIRRSVVSISANIAEGHARSTRREYAHFCFTARGSLAETQCLLQLAEDLGYLQPDDYGRLIELCDTVGKMLNALIKFLRGER